MDKNDIYRQQDIQFIDAFNKRMQQDIDDVAEEINNGRRYVKIYTELEKNGVSPLQRRNFMTLCFNAQPDLVSEKEGLITAEYMIDQFNKCLEESKDASAFAIGVAANGALEEKCGYELMESINDGKSSTGNWAKIADYIYAKAKQLGWNGYFANGLQWNEKPRFITFPDKSPLSSPSSKNNASTYKSTSSSQYEDENTSYSKSSGGCYVATAVYGSYDCPEVWTLRRFRDLYLYQSWYGRVFIKSYYAVSPTLVRIFGETDWFKRFWKNKLDKLVISLKHKGFDDSPYSD